MTKLLAFRGDPLVTRERFLEEMNWHEDQDRVTQLTYGESCNTENFRGCGVGCTINSLARITGLKLNTSQHSICGLS